MPLKVGRTRVEQDQTGLQSLQLNLRLKIVGLDGAEDLTHDHVQLVQTGCPAGREKQAKYPEHSWHKRREEPFPRAHLPWKSRLSSRQALMETSAESACLFIISTRLTWRPLDSSSGRI